MIILEYYVYQFDINFNKYISLSNTNKDNAIKKSWFIDEIYAFW